MSTIGPGSMKIDLTPDRTRVRVHIALDDGSDEMDYIFTPHDYLQFALEVELEDGVAILVWPFADAESA